VNLDVAVVGGGIVGTATAAFLAEAGARVALFEATEIAAGASGRNSGVVQQPFDEVLASLYRRSLELYQELAAELPGSFRIDERPAGLLYVGPAAANAADLALIRQCTDYAVDAALRGESGVVGQDEDRGGELRAIEFERIKGGKKFDASVPWFTGLLRELGQA